MKKLVKQKNVLTEKEVRFMRAKMRRLLSVVMAVIMVVSLDIFPAGAAEESVKVPALSSSTKSSITLKTEKDYVYGIQMAKQEKGKEAVWIWAEAAQYDKTAGTVCFSGLKAGTSYTVGRKAADSKSTEVLTQVYKTKEAKAAEQPKVEEKVQTGTMEKKVPAKDTKETVSSEKPEKIKTPEQKVTEETKKNETTEQKTAEKIDTPKQNVPENQKNTDPQKANTEEKGKADTPKEDPKNNKEGSDVIPAPEAPVLKEKTDTTVKLEVKEGLEYARCEGEEKTWVWNTTGIFEQLQPNTKYTFAARVKATETTAASPASVVLEVVTLKPAAEAPAAPAVEARTDTMIRLKKTEDVEYRLNDGSEKIVWTDQPEFTGLLPGTSYEFLARVKYQAEDTMPSKESKISITTLKSAAAAPSEPAIAERTETKITLKGSEGQEYAMLKDGAPGNWQESPVFSGLKPDTRYEFVTRMAYDPDTAMESLVSGKANTKTVMSFDGTSVKGVEKGKTYETGNTLKMEAVGKGLDNKKPQTADTRWVPSGWDWGSKSGTWEKSPYTSELKLTKTGNYLLEVTFSLEEYKEDGWYPMNRTETIEVTFKVVAPTVYEIKASAGTNGKISPSGTVKVDKGDDREFKFTPNTGYKVDKVTVDGKKVTVSNNKYRFKDVKADHTISVTFVKTSTTNTKTTSKTTPKTGDTTNVLILWGLMLGALLVGVGCTAALKKEKKNR